MRTVIENKSRNKQKSNKKKKNKEDSNDTKENKYNKKQCYKIRKYYYY